MREEIENVFDESHERASFSGLSDVASAKIGQIFSLSAMRSFSLSFGLSVLFSKLSEKNYFTSHSASSLKAQKPKAHSNENKINFGRMVAGACSSGDFPWRWQIVGRKSFSISFSIIRSIHLTGERWDERSE